MEKTLNALLTSRVDHLKTKDVILKKNSDNTYDLITNWQYVKTFSDKYLYTNISSLYRQYKD